MRNENEVEPEPNKCEDALIAIRDHGWSFVSIGNGRRTLLVPPEGYKREHWTSKWDKHGIPDWLPNYSQEKRNAV